MASKIKKTLIVGSLVAGLFMSISACNMNDYFKPSNDNNNPSSSIMPSSNGDFISSSLEPEETHLLNITATSNKNSYVYGEEELDLSVQAHYSDGTNTNVSEYQVTGYDCRNPGQQEITVLFEDKTCTLNVTVANPLLVNITATSNKEAYGYGEDLNLTVKANYEDGSSVTINDYDVKGYNNKLPGEQEVTVTFQEKTYQLNVFVKDPALVSITAVSNKDSYEYGDQLDVTVLANYEDGKSIEITDYQVEGFNSEIPGVQTLAFTYENAHCSLDVSVNERTNFFPTNKFTSFLQIEGIETEIPTPNSYKTEWTDGTDIQPDGSKVFIATTNDKGTVGVDSLTDQYAISLKNAGWTVNKDGDEYTAIKSEGDAMLSFATNNQVFSFKVSFYCEFPDTAISGSAIKTKANLDVNETIVMGVSQSEIIAYSLGDGYLLTKGCNYTNDVPSTIEKSVVRFTLSKVNNSWTLSDAKGRKLGATELNHLVWDEGSTEWSITFSNGSAVISNTERDFGRLCYNPETGTISNYKSAFNTNLVYLELFELKTIDLIYPTSISLSGKDQIGLGKTRRLDLEYYPENVNSLNDVYWSSSDETVATVNETGLISAVSIGKTTITAKAKAKNSYLQSSFEVEITEQALDNWTILLYICGADLESDSGCATTDIGEILKVNNQPEGVNIVLQTGGAKKWQKYGISSSVLSRYHVENKALVLDQTLPNASMGDQATLESFLNWGLQEYPADRTGLVFWNHGGALDGCCFDEKFGGSLKNSETSAAFKNVFEENNIDKLEFVGYDCCLMQVQDIAEFNSHYFNYMIGSEEAEMGSGWKYDAWIDDVYANKDTPTILKANCDGTLSAWGTSSDQTLSYLDLSKMANYRAKFEALASSIKNTAKNNYSSFRTLLGKVKSYGGSWYISGLDSYGTIDGYDFLNKLSNDSKYSSNQTEINEAKAAYKQVVAYSRAGTSAGQSNGLVVIAATNTSYVPYPTSETSFNNWRSIFF